MRRVVIVLLIITACSRHSEHTSGEKRDYNNGWNFEWYNHYSKNINLSENKNSSDSSWISQAKFCTGVKYSMSDVWGRGKEAAGIYLQEYLPSFFKRRLILNEFNPADGDLSWLFTGDKGGITIIVDSLKIRLVQRYYNSIALNKMKDSIMFARRHGEKEIIRSVIEYSGKINDLIIEMNSNQRIRLYANGMLIAEQFSLLDLTQHQLRYNGTRGNICGEVFCPTVSSARIHVNPDSIHQEIIGFGGITSIPSYNDLSEEGKSKWWALLKEYNLLIQREYPNGSRLNEQCSNFDSIGQAVPHYYGDNFPNGEISDFSYNKKVLDLGGMVIFEFWQLPRWALKAMDNPVPIYDKYAQAVFNYCKQSVAKAGKAPEIVGIQNEVEQSDTAWQQMALHLRKALDENGFKNIKIHMHNNSILAGGIKAAKAFKALPDVWNKIDYSASNLYDYQAYKMDVDAYDTVISKWNAITESKPFISTELCQNDNVLQDQSYKTAFFMGQLYHKNMVMMDASVVMYCWLLAKTVQPSYQASRALFSIDMSNNFVPVPSSFQLRVFGSYSRHLMKGMKRLDATSDDKDILVSAYADKSHQTLVISNRGMVEKKIILDWKNISFTKGELTNQYNANKSLKIREELSLKPGDILTLME